MGKIGVVEEERLGAGRSDGGRRGLAGWGLGMPSCRRRGVGSVECCALVHKRKAAANERAVVGSFQ